MNERIEVRCSYSAESWPEYDAAVYAAAGRVSDFSGMGMGERDHGWVCGSEIEAERIKRGLAGIGLAPIIRIR